LLIAIRKKGDGDMSRDWRLPVGDFFAELAVAQACLTQCDNPETQKPDFRGPAEDWPQYRLHPEVRRLLHEAGIIPETTISVLRNRGGYQIFHG